MGKGKPRHNPYKFQHKYDGYRGDICTYAEEDGKGGIHCEGSFGDTSICKGNRHNCCKVKYHIWASQKK